MTSIPFPSEKFIEDFVCSRIGADRECPVSGEFVNIAYRQKEIKGYGVTDVIKIMVYPGYVQVVVLELKNEPLKEAHISQLARYMRGVERVVKKYERAMPDGWEISVYGELAGPFDKNKGDLPYLLSLLNDRITVYDLSASMDDGFSASIVSDGWYSTSENVFCYKDVARKLAREIFSTMKQVGIVEESNVIPMERNNGQG